MLEALRQIFNRSIASLEKPFDPSVFKDTLALQTSWNPLTSGDDSFQTHEWVLATFDRAEFRVTTGYKLFLRRLHRGRNCLRATGIF